jgi:phosphohistidine phosphatase SixA
MQKFRAKKVDLLIATDVAARGLDVKHVSHVVNFDVPAFRRERTCTASAARGGPGARAWRSRWPSRASTGCCATSSGRRPEDRDRAGAHGGRPAARRQELVERAGNFGVPLAMLLWVGLPRTRRDWLAPLEAPPLERPRAVGTALAWTTGLLLIGHGALAVGEKPLLLGHFAALGLGREWVVVAGWLEIALGVAAIVRPLRGLLLGAAAWKIGTELLFPITGAPVWEWIERGGSYGAPIAFALIGAHLILSRRTVMPKRQTATAASFVLLLLGLITGVANAQESSLLAQLREGGHVLACRHAITGPEGNSSASDPRDRERNLSDEGVQQAKRMGAAIAELRIPIGSVLSSRYYRTRESAEYAFGRVETVDSLQSPKSKEAFPRMLATPPRAGTNTVLMTHQGVINPVLSQAIGGRVAEGDCVVVRPGGSAGYEVVRNVAADEWAQLAMR